MYEHNFYNNINCVKYFYEPEDIVILNLIIYLSDVAF